MSLRDDTPLEKLGLSPRARNTLLRNGVRTVGELVACGDVQVLAIRNFGGRRQLLEVKQRLADLGFLDRDKVRQASDDFWSEPL